MLNPFALLPRAAQVWIVIGCAVVTAVVVFGTKADP